MYVHIVVCEFLAPADESIHSPTAVPSTSTLLDFGASSAVEKVPSLRERVESQKNHESNPAHNRKIRVVHPSPAALTPNSLADDASHMAPRSACRFASPVPAENSVRGAKKDKRILDGSRVSGGSPTPRKVSRLSPPESISSQTTPGNAFRGALHGHQCLQLSKNHNAGKKKPIAGRILRPQFMPIPIMRTINCRHLMVEAMPVEGFFNCLVALKVLLPRPRRAVCTMRMAQVPRLPVSNIVLSFAFSFFIATIHFLPNSNLGERSRLSASFFTAADAERKFDFLNH